MKNKIKKIRHMLLKIIYKKIKIYEFCSLSFFYLIKPFSFFYKFCRFKKIYVLTEKGFDAADNAYYLYKYLKKKKCRCFFILSKSSEDINNIKKNDLIYPNSLKHYFYIQTANYVLYEDLYYLPKYINVFKRCISAKLIFLQHGVITNYVQGYFMSVFDLFVTSTKPEKNFVIKMTNSTKDKVILTGLARFDDIYNNTVKDLKLILVMPTWRFGICNKNDLLKSLYMKKWLSLLKNKELINFCKKNNYEVLFYPHINVRKFLDNNLFDNNKVKGKKWSVHDLLINCTLLITDFSSVAFDVAYQMKPVIYYQFDEDYYYKYHQPKGYYDYKNGVGYYFNDESLVVHKIINLIKFGIDDNMKNKIKSTFYKIDNKNCERLFNEIKKI